MPAITSNMRGVAQRLDKAIQDGTRAADIFRPIASDKLLGPNADPAAGGKVVPFWMHPAYDPAAPQCVAAMDWGLSVPEEFRGGFAPGTFEGISAAHAGAEQALTDIRSFHLPTTLDDSLAALRAMKQQVDAQVHP